MLELTPQEQKTIISFDAGDGQMLITTFDKSFIKRLKKANATLIEQDERTGKHVFQAPKNMLMLKTLSVSAE